MVEEVERVIGVLNEIRPELIAKGGDVKLAGFSEGVVYVCLAGPFAARCLTKRRVLWNIEQVLRTRLPWIERVEAVCPPPESQAR